MSGAGARSPFAGSAQVSGYPLGNCPYCDVPLLTTFVGFRLTWRHDGLGWRHTTCCPQVPDAPAPSGVGDRPSSRSSARVFSSSAADKPDGIEHPACHEARSPVGLDPSSAYWNGDEWRWRLAGRGPTTITVIDSAEERQVPANAVRVPFGFSRVLVEPLGAVEVEAPEPLIWEGDGA